MRSQTVRKAVGAALLLLAAFGFFVFVYRLCVYHYEYDPQYSPVDYGKFNILSYFTVQSNFACYVYFLFAGLALLGVKKAEKIGFSKVFGGLVTLYVLVAGITYTAGIPMGLTPPFKWDTAAHGFSSFIQIYYHMIIPPAALLYWLFPATEKETPRRVLPLSAVYPLVYSVFSILRGRFGAMRYVPYPFYDPAFLWGLVNKSDPVNEPVAYLMMAGLLVFGIGLFVALMAILRALGNRRVRRLEKS